MAFGCTTLGVIERTDGVRHDEVSELEQLDRSQHGGSTGSVEREPEVVGRAIGQVTY